jgi:hypothetical protein
MKIALPAIACLRAGVIALTALAVLPPARAHYIWLESAPGEARVFFGEYDNALRETSPGRLDTITGLALRALAANGTVAPLAPAKTAACFLAPLQSAPAALVAENLNLEVKDWRASGLGLVKPMFYARALVVGAPAPTRPVLPLDILPDATKPGVFRVFLRGQALVKAKLLVHAPNTWSREEAPDADGRFVITTPWPGLYVLEVIHVETASGEFGGKSYEAIRHRATLSLRVP